MLYLLTAIKEYDSFVVRMRGDPARFGEICGHYVVSADNVVGWSGQKRPGLNRHTYRQTDRETGRVDRGRDRVDRRFTRCDNIRAL